MTRLIFFVACQFFLRQQTFGWQLPEKEDYTDHPCIRSCLNNDGPMTCEYNFTTEYYQAMSHACYGCPNNGTDCDRPHCVIGDGIPRPTKVVNRMIPGPALHVCRADTIIVNVYNELDDFEGTTIHWHGVLQYGTPHMDGVTMVTQCPIPAHTMFQYKFKVDNAGTHYWHAHAAHQRSDGINGAIVVRDIEDAPVRQTYDFDLPEHTLVVQDWLEDLTSVVYTMHHHGTRADLPRSILINGRGNVENGTIPDHVYRVSKDNRYRFRVISNGVANCPLKLSVENHKITLISSDGNDMDPIEVDAFFLFGGERYDFVLNANQSASNYWMYVTTNCEGKKLVQTTIIRYSGASDGAPSTGKTFEDGDRQGLIANPVELAPEMSPNVKLVSELTSDHSTDPITSDDVKTFYMGMEFNDLESDMFLHPVYYPLSLFRDASGEEDENHLFPLQINKITHVIPWSPVLTQYDQFSEGDFCNDTSVHQNCSAELCRCIHRVKVALNDVVEFVLVSGGKGGLGNHPMHLHGLSYHVIGMGKMNSTITRAEVKMMDRNSSLPRNLENPVKKDTVMVPDGGYTIIRFKADNPELEEIPKPPRNFPKCGHYSYTESNEPELPVCASAGLIQLMGVPVLCVALFVVLFQNTFINTIY